jgi:hypothetical protein
MRPEAYEIFFRDIFLVKLLHLTSLRMTIIMNR